MSEKLIGHLLLWIGIAIMIISLINIFLVFTGRLKPITVINLTSISKVAPSGGIDITTMFPNMAEEQREQIKAMGNINPVAGFSSEMMNEIISFSTHFLLLTMFMGFGHKLASLGTNLLKPVAITIDQNKVGSSM